jgi:hypothetical protein
MIPIKDAVGRPIKCPDCGAIAMVAHTKSRVLTVVATPIPDRPGQFTENAPDDSGRIATARLWYMVDCPKAGKKLFKHDTKVEVTP